jgi:hypothetical protein
MNKTSKTQKKLIGPVCVAAAIATVVALFTTRQFDVTLSIALWVAAFGLWNKTRKDGQ